MEANQTSDDSTGAPTINKNQNAPKNGRQYDVPRGHQRPDRYKGKVIRAAPYELPESEYKSSTLDVRMVKSPAYND